MTFKIDIKNIEDNVKKHGAGSKLLYEVFGLPILQNRLYATAYEARACPKGVLRLVQNMSTGLIYNSSFQQKLIKYDVCYQNEQAVSSLFQDHLKSVAQIIRQKMGSDSLVEIGCGKGFFLEMLIAQGVEISGFDPAYEGDNPKIERSYFSSGSGIKAQGIILRHVLEHIQNPIDFLFRLKKANQGAGKIYIEVPCFDWICEKRAWFDLYYEHVNYFRLSDFYRIFGKIIASGHFFGNQYFYIVADLATLRIPNIDCLQDHVVFPPDFLQTLDKGYKGQDTVNASAVWGGASKGVIFALLRERIGKPVDLVIDINPAKQGKYIPGTGIRVLSPREALTILPKDSIVFVMNSNYMDEIKEISNNMYTYQGVDNDEL